MTSVRFFISLLSFNLVDLSIGWNLPSSVFCKAGFVDRGGLNIPDWGQVKVDLQKVLHEKELDSVPIVTFSIWHLVKDALLTEKVKVKEQLAEAEQSLEKIQEEEVRKSISATDTQSEDKKESQFKTKAENMKVKGLSSSSSSESDSEEEERLEQEIVDLK
ncbi:hypothetical protein STEG23_034913 [Scotinomys teguina]